jgi:hypothetical protein
MSNAKYRTTHNHAVELCYTYEVETIFNINLLQRESESTIICTTMVIQYICCILESLSLSLSPYFFLIVKISTLDKGSGRTGG